MQAGRSVVLRKGWVASVRLPKSLMSLSPSLAVCRLPAPDLGAPGEGARRAPGSLPGKLVCLSIKDFVAWAG